MWVYDKNGNSDHQMNAREFPINNTAARGLNWDYYVIGGNKSWVYGSSMQSWYFVDDFIVDAGSKGPIGPRYFNIIGN